MGVCQSLPRVKIKLEMNAGDTAALSQVLMAYFHLFTAVACRSDQDKTQRLAISHLERWWKRILRG